MQTSAGGGSAPAPPAVEDGTFVEEAAAGAGVAGHVAHLLDREQQHVGVAVVAEPAQLLEMAAGGALVPQLAARAAPVVHLAACQCALDRLPVHPGHHQHRPVEPVLRHRRDEASRIEPEGRRECLHQGRGPREV